LQTGVDGSSENQQDNRFCSIVWSAVPAYAEQLMAMDDDDFKQALADAFEHKLGAIKNCSQRYSFPLRQRHSVDYIQQGLVLVGDAAHTIHPLAGQGVNLGLMDALVLSEEILRAHQRQLNIGSLVVLQRYQRRRKAANLSMMAAMEGFKRLFAADALPLHKLSPIKQRIMRQAMGL
jgi:2-octaprenylphenol hydroxylase